MLNITYTRLGVIRVYFFIPCLGLGPELVLRHTRLIRSRQVEVRAFPNSESRVVADLLACSRSQKHVQDVVVSVALGVVRGTVAESLTGSEKSEYILCVDVCACLEEKLHYRHGARSDRLVQQRRPLLVPYIQSHAWVGGQYGFDLFPDEIRSEKVRR